MIIKGEAGECGLEDGVDLAQRWSSEYVLFSIVIAQMGAYTTVAIFRNMRHVMARRWYAHLLGMSGIAFGYSTVWCMHFVGMKGLTLQGITLDGSVCEISIRFDLPLTVLSVLAVVGMSWIGIHIMAGRKVQKRGRLDMEGFCRLILAGGLAAVGVLMMHYLGMLSQVGSFEMSYRLHVVLTSAIVAAIVATSGIFILMRFPSTPIARLASSSTIALAVSGTHYVGMYSATYEAYTSFNTGRTNTIDIPGLMVAASALLMNQILLTMNARYHSAREDSKSQFLAEAEYAHNVSKSQILLDSVLAPRFPMVLVQLCTFRALGKLSRYEDLRDKKLLLYLDTLELVQRMRAAGAVLLFFSHQWLGDSEPDPRNEHYAAIARAADDFSKARNINEESVYIWVDYSCVPQISLESQQLAIDSIAFYTSVCNAFIVIAPTTKRTCGRTADFVTYGSRLWCRFEVFTKILGVCCASDFNISCAPATTGMSETETTPKALTLLVLEDEIWAVPRSGSQLIVREDAPEAMFVVDADGGALRPLNPWEVASDGTGLRLREEMRQLCFCYEGALTCCSRNHVVNGVRIRCDKHRLVDVFVGLYGRVLRKVCEAKRPRSMQSYDQVGAKAPIPRRSTLEVMPSCDFSGESAPELCKAIAIKSLVSDGRMFPEEYFGSRIEAMEDFLWSDFEDVTPSGTQSDASRPAVSRTLTSRTEVCDVRDVAGCNSNSMA